MKPWIVFSGALVASTPAWAETVYTDPQPIGQGEVQVYADVGADGTPNAIGFQLSAAALDGLPLEMNAAPTSRCFDKDNNGAITAHGECVGDYELGFALPAGLAEGGKTPFKWAMVNWNPMGHLPPAPPPWAVPHFDFHFYIQPEEEVRAIRTGPCAEMINCDDFVVAQKPVPAAYIHPDFIDVGAAVPAMGNHLIDSKAVELAPGGPPFTHTWIYGAYDGKVFFYEPMITSDFLLSGPDECVPLKQPAAFEQAGFYPTEYCMRTVQTAEGTFYTISLESFVAREAG